MANIKEKAKNFWENHKTDICVVGSIAAVSIGAGVLAYKAYMGGFNYGVMAGFNATLDWLDKTFPEESKARELYEAWAKEHPDQLVWVKPSGKMITN